MNKISWVNVFSGRGQIKRMKRAGGPLLQQSLYFTKKPKLEGEVGKKHSGTTTFLPARGASTSDNAHLNTSNGPGSFMAKTPDTLALSMAANTSDKRSFNELPGLNVDYYPKFLKSQAGAILKEMEAQVTPLLHKNEVKIMGKLCKIPRKQEAFGDEGLSYNFSGVSVAAKPWIPVLKKFRDILVESLALDFNFVLVNHYKDGHDHIGEHRDDERDLVPGSPIACLSFGQERDFVLKHKDSRGKDAKRKDMKPIQLPLQHGSLLVMCHPTNTDWYHSLPVRKKALHPRISLTFRKLKS